MVFSIILHEIAHGYAAWRMGDPTARAARRITLNPLAHIDPIGSVVVPLILLATGGPLLAWAKPVPFDPSYFRNVRKGVMIVGAAGPLTNLAIAIVAGLGCRLVGHSIPFVGLIFAYGCVINVMLALFNALPIPPLDGSRIMVGLLPPRLAMNYMRLERFGIIIVFALLWLGALDYVLNPLKDVMYHILLPSS